MSYQRIHDPLSISNTTYISNTPSLTHPHTHPLTHPFHPVYHNSRKMSNAPTFLMSRARAATSTRGTRANTLAIPPPQNSMMTSHFPLSSSATDDVSPDGDVFDVVGNPMLSNSNRSDDEMPGHARRSITA